MIDEQTEKDLCGSYNNFWKKMMTLTAEERDHFINHCEKTMIRHGYDDFMVYNDEDEVKSETDSPNTPDDELKARWTRLYESTGDEFREVIKDAQHLSVEEQERLLEYFWYCTVENIGELGLATAGESDGYAKYTEDVKKIESRDDCNEQSII